MNMSFTDILLQKIKGHHCGRSIRDLTIAHKDNFIVLGGKTNSYYLKQVVQELVLKNLLGRNLVLQNEIFVEY